MPANKFPIAILLILSLIMALCISAQSQSHYSHYHPFDSTGIFKEKVVVPFDPIGSWVPAEGRKGPPTGLDSLSLEKIDYLASLLEGNHKLVIRVLLYDDFYLQKNYQFHSVYFTYMRAQRVLRKVQRKSIDRQRIEFYYTSCIPGGFRHEELLSTDKRLAFWVYELPAY